jgi:TolA-binding protein
MRDADAEAQLGRFENAHQRSRQAASLAPRDTVLAELDERYRTAGAYFPDLSDSLHTPGGAATHDGVMKFIEGKDKEALASLANARALMPSPAHDGLIRVLEAKVGSPAPSVSTAAAVAPSTAVAASSSTATAVAASSSTAAAAAAVSTAPVSGAEALKRILDSTSALMEVAFYQQEWDKVVKLGDQVIALEPGNVLAYKRLAGAYHAMNRHPEALKALKAAYALEPDEAEREKLKAYVGAMKALVDKESRPAVAKAVKKTAGGPEDVERLYEAGVELYAQGRLIEAREAFRRCLQVDANYTPAQRAFSRVQSEMMQTGKEK